MSATMNETVIPAQPLRKNDLKDLIERAAAGDQEAARLLVSPFVCKGEKLINYGISAKFGIFTTYDFLFLTDRQIGDLEITPLTGNLNVEVAYLNKIDAFTLTQPAFPILMRLMLWMSYLWFPYFLFFLTFTIFGAILGNVLGAIFGIAGAIGGVYLTFKAVNPAIMRSFLRFKKSGLWLKLHGSNLGVLIFADRDKFEMVTRVSRQVSELKRALDSGQV
jgi:hypothetical protein